MNGDGLKKRYLDGLMQACLVAGIFVTLASFSTRTNAQDLLYGLEQRGVHRANQLVWADDAADDAATLRTPDLLYRWDVSEPERAPVHSTPIALSPDEQLLWAVNPDSDSVTVIRTDTEEVIARLPVGDSPRSLAVHPSGRFVYVANEGSNELSFIYVASAHPDRFWATTLAHTITTGSAPISVVVSPDGRRIFVANAVQDTITVIDAHWRRAIGAIDLRSSLCNVDDSGRHFHPRALAITADSRQLYVTRFLSYTRPGGSQRADEGKEGLVCGVRIDTRSDRIGDYTPSTAIRMAPTQTGFHDRNQRMTAAFPNQLGSLVLRDGHAYLPNIAASPSGPLRFDVDTQAFVNRIDGIRAKPVNGGVLNLHLGGRDPEPGKRELYFANPVAMAFGSAHGAGTAYVVSAGSDVLVKLNVDLAGALSFTVDDDTTRYIDLNDPEDPATSGRNAGKNPVGIAIDASGTMAYVLNYVSRNVSVVNLIEDRVDAVVSTEDLPSPGSYDEVLLVGAEVFFSSRGNFVHDANAPGSAQNRMSEKGHQSCASCHFNGLSDGVVWQFASGPRKTIAINGTFDPHDTSEQRIINASAIFDELEDVEFNTRRVSSGEPLSTPLACVDTPPFDSVGVSTNDPGHGLILGQEGNFAQAACVLNPFARSNAGRPQARVQLPGSPVQVRAMDAMKEWQRSAVLTPNRPLTAQELAAAGLGWHSGADDKRVARGEQLFVSAGCPACHGGGQWTKGQKDFVSPPLAAEISSEAGAPTANQAPYLHRFLTDIGSFALNVAGGKNLLPGFPAIGGIEKDTNELDALGFDYNQDGQGSGYNTPSLLGVHVVPPYYHNGACETLACVLADTRHRRAGLAPDARDPLDDARARADLVLYLESIDEAAPPHAPKQ